MKIPKTNELQKQAKSYNRKRLRSITKKYIKGIGKIIKAEAKSGHSYYFKTFRENSRDSWEVFIAMRWYRRFSGLTVEIEERVNEHLSGKKRIIDEMDVRIKWL